MRPIFRRPEGDLKSMVYLHEKYCESREILMQEDLEIAEMDGSMVSLAKKRTDNDEGGGRSLTKWFSYEKVYLAPVSSLESVRGMCERLGNLQVMLVASTPGSGVDVLLQSLINVPGTVTISSVEGAGLAFEQFFAEKMARPELAPLLTNLILRQILRSVGEDTSRVILELPGVEGLDEAVIGDLKRFCPRTKRLFFTRNPRDSIMNTPASSSRGGRNELARTRSVREMVASYKKRVSCLPWTDLGSNVLATSSNETGENAEFERTADSYCLILKKVVESGSAQDLVILFDDVISQPVYVTASFFRVLGLPIETVLDALASDEDHAKEETVEELSEEKIKILDEVLAKHGLPSSNDLNDRRLKTMLEKSKIAN